MDVIAVLKQKGGAGATTLAVHLAVAAAEAGRRPLILDVDPQRSAFAWGQDRADRAELDGAAPAQPPVAAAGAGDLPGLIAEAAAAGYDLVLIDTPPHNSGVTASVARAASLALIPSKPDTIDLRALPSMLLIVRATGTPSILVLNACPDRAPEVGEARAWLEGAAAAADGPRTRVWHGQVSVRRSFPRAYGKGLGVTEFDPRGKAAAEIRDLWAYIARAVRK